jgi:hypothetical protein
MDVFRDLPRLTWRGIEVPVANRSVSFDQTIVRHQYAYRDDELLESVGRRNWRFQYTIPFRQDITKGPYQNLFVLTYPEFLRACRDRSEGELLDPVLGTFMARCEQVNTTSDVNRRDGDDVEVTFIHSPDAEDIDQFGAPLAGFDAVVQGGWTLNTQLSSITDAELQEYGLGTFEGTAGDFGSSLNILDSIAGLGAQATAYAGRVDAALAKYEHQINKVADALQAVDEQLLSPGNAAAIRNARRLADSVARLGKQLINERFGSENRTKTSTVLLDSMTPNAAAAYLGITIQEFVTLNPKVPLPLIPAGTVVFYFVKA